MMIAQAVSSDPHTQEFIALIALVGTSIGALVYTIKNNRLGKDINRAVNNVGPGEHHLIELIQQIRAKQEEFDKKWGNLPGDMDDAVTLAGTIHDIHTAIATMKNELREHVEWEMSQKYPSRE